MYKFVGARVSTGLAGFLFCTVESVARIFKTRPFPMTRITAAALSVDLRQTYFEWGQGRRGLIGGRERFDLELDARMGRVRLGFTAPALSFRVSVFALFFVFVFMFFAAG